MGQFDVNGMTLRYCEITVEEFDSLTPGTPLTAAQRKRFHAPGSVKVERGTGRRGKRARKAKTITREFDLYSEVTQTVQSVVNAAGKAGTKFCYLETPGHKAADETDRSTNSRVNDAGIYLNTEAARAATTIPQGGNDKKSWNHLVVPFKIRSNPTRSAIGNSPTTEQNSTWPSEESDATSSHPTVTPSSHAAPGTPSDDFTSDTCSIQSEEPPTPLPLDSAPCTEGASCIGDSEEVKDILAEFAECTFNVFKHQHRVSAWTVYITDDHARLVYFERAGAFVSQSFNWTQQDSPLHTFIWKLVHMSYEALGYDPSASEPSKEDLNRLRNATNSLSLHPAVKRLIEEEMGNGYPLYKLCVTSYPTQVEDAFPDEASAADPTRDSAQCASSSIGKPPACDSAAWSHRYFIVGRPQFTADSLIGRCTRGYVAYDLQDNAFYHLKDLWRSRLPGRVRPEHLVYERLHKYDVLGIAPLICGGDVGGPCGQVTGVQDAFPAEKRPAALIHYRIVTGKIGVPLTSFQSFKELTGVLEDAITSHYYAWTDAKVLHHDISVGNILIDPDTREGILIDWDLSLLECELQRQAAKPDRTGTWPFRSGLSQRYPYKPYRVADDIESFVHVFHYLVLRFHYTDVDRLSDEVESRYQRSDVIDGIKVGGRAKIKGFSTNAAPFQVKWNPDLQNVLDELARQCFESYSHIDHKYMERVFGTSEDRVKQVYQPLEQRGRPNPRPRKVPRKGFSRLPSASSSLDRQCQPEQSQVEGFLASHGTVIDVLELYTPSIRDKQKDQFEERAASHRWTAGTKTRDSSSHLSEDQPLSMASNGDVGVSSSEHSPPGVTSPTSQPSLDESISSGSYVSRPNAGPGVSKCTVGSTQQSRKRKRGPEEEGMVEEVRPVKRESKHW